MLWVLCSIAAIMIGIAMFAKVQTDLPPELEFLKSKPAAADVLDAGTKVGTNMAAIPLDGPATGWTFQTDGTISEASKDFNQHIAGPNGREYDKPAFAITCYQGTLYARVNTRVSAAGRAPIAFDLNGLPAWTSAANQNWYSADPAKTLTMLKASGSVGARIAFEELGTQKFTFNTNGLSAIVGKMKGCKL